MDSTQDLPAPGKLDRSSELFLVQIIFVVIAGVCLLARAYIKCFIIKINSLDDYLLYGAMVVYTAYSAIVIDGCLNGATGKHPSIDISLDKAAHSLRSWYICMVLYPAITLAIRASVCVLLFRLNSKRSYLWIIWINLVVTTLASVAFFFILVFQCSPPQYFWRQLYGDIGYCHEKLIVTYSATVYSVLSALSDWCLGLLPIAILWTVQINLRTKVVIAGLLSLGMIAGVVLLVRATYITRLEPGLLFLYESTDVAIWSVMEPALGIIAACVATFRPLFKGCGFGWNSRRRGHSTHYPLSPQRPLDGFTPATSPRLAAFNRPFEAIDDKSDPDGGSEQDFAIRKTVQIRVTSARHEYPRQVAFGSGGGSVHRYSPDLPGRAISCDGPYSTELKDTSIYNHRATV